MSKLLNLPGIKQYFQKYNLDKQEALKGNREEVLLLYRHLLKKIPPKIEKPIPRQQKITEIKHLFKESKDEDLLDNIQWSKEVAYNVLENVEKGLYPPFPAYYPNYAPHLESLGNSRVNTNTANARDNPE